MRLILGSCVMFVLLALAPGVNTSAQADPFGCDSVPVNSLVEFVAVDSAAACGGGTGLIWKGSHSDEWGFLHWDCIYFTDWPYYQSWFVHGC